jgi:small subunit ribosomal protein S9
MEKKKKDLSTNLNSVKNKSIKVDKVEKDNKLFVPSKSFSVKEKKAFTSVTLKVPKEFFYGTGRRKTAIAKAWLFKGNGTILVKKKTIQDYFKSPILVQTILKPLQKLGLESKYDVKVSPLGGGLVGQADAVQLAITNALLSMNSDFRKSLKEDGLITRDPREKERKKYGRKKARKGFQYRKR